MAGHIKSISGIVVSLLIAPSDALLFYCKSREFHNFWIGDDIGK